MWCILAFQSTLDDFLELFFQFGYVFLFSAVYPVAGFWALVSNLIELRMDAFKLCFILRKPAPKQCDGIGTWLVGFRQLAFTLGCYFKLIVWACKWLKQLLLHFVMKKLSDNVEMSLLCHQHPSKCFSSNYDSPGGF